VRVAGAKKVLSQRVFHVSRIPVEQEHQQRHAAVENGGEYDQKDAGDAARLRTQHGIVPQYLLEFAP